MKILFWNINKSYVPKALSALAGQEDPDILIIAENTIPISTILKQLNDKKVRYNYSRSPGCSKLTTFTMFDPKYFAPVSEYDRVSIRIFSITGVEPLLIVMVHMPDKRNWSDEDQYFETVRLADTIRMAESQHKINNTILIGDLNMNPFEVGVVAAKGLHAVPSKMIARKISRKVQGIEYPFFYNPMWNYFGDETPGPSGTYYYSDSTQVNLFWHMFDQILIRPSILEKGFTTRSSIIDVDLRGITSDNGSKKTPDHYPIIFEIRL